MAKIKKDNLLMLIGALEKINCQVPVKPKFEDEVYAWCQSQALDLGNYIEAAYENVDTKPIVHALEEYCENIYLLSQIETKEDRRELANQIQKSIGVIKRFIQEELPKDEE